MTPEARAADILRRQRYLVLGTVDADGPWTAALQYRLLRGGAMYVETHTETRHSRAVLDDPRVSAAIIDTDAEADGVQLAATARIVAAAHVDAVLARQLSSTPPYDLATPGKHLIELTVTALYVFDHAAWARTRLDARLAVDPAAVFALL